MEPSHSSFVIPLVRSLRGDILAQYGSVGYDYKRDKTVVTEIDIAVERKLVDVLSGKYPHIGFLGEELGQQGSTERYWLIDPIDGTESYIRGLPGVTSILGLVEHGEITQTYVYDPVEDVMYSAKKDGGAFADDTPISVSTRSVEQAIISISGTEKVEPFVKAAQEAGVFYLTQYYGRGLKSVYMASGKIEGMVIASGRGGMWDMAPTTMLAREAGALYTSIDGRGLDSRSYCLFTPSVNEALLPIAQEFVDA